MKKALIIAATAGFINGFLWHDISLLQKMGYEVHCAANGKSAETFNPKVLFTSRNVVFHQVDFAARRPLSKETLIAYKQVKKIIHENDFALIHCHTPIVGAIVRIAAIGVRRDGCKILYTTHGLSFPKGCKLKDKLLYGGVETVCSYLCDGIVTINWEDYHVVNKMGCKHVYHINGVGVNTERFHEVMVDRQTFRKCIGVHPEDIFILAVGELSERKNHQVIIKALSLLKDERYHFVICGKAMEESGTYKLLKKMAEEMHVRVTFLGFRHDIPQITSCADIAVLPSIREGLGLAGVEALACGVPVIGSAVQGIKDYVIDGKTGFLCDPMNAQQFAQRIAELSDPQVRAGMKQACISKAEEFKCEISYKQMEEIYRDILVNL